MRFFLPLLSVLCVFAQVKALEPPLSLDVLTEGLSDPVLAEVPGLTKEVLARGIDFDLNQKLAVILTAAAEGHRAPAEVAALIAAALDNCQKCYARFLAPLSSEELLTLLKRGHDNDILLQEVKARGVKDLEISEANANVLRTAGANEELVNFLVPDDKVKIGNLIGYQPFELKHAEDYDPSASEGWLKVTAEIPANSTSEFAFIHNALFGRAVKGGEPTVRSAYFNKPAPRHTDFAHIKFTPSLEGGEATGGEEKRSGGFLGIGKGKSKDEKAKDAPSLDVAYPSEDRTGRNSFQITLANKQSTPQEVSFMVRWTVLADPQPLTAPPPKPAPAKK
jgi:hypothetical protein